MNACLLASSFSNPLGCTLSEAKKIVMLARPDPGLGKYTVVENVAKRFLTARMKAAREAARTPGIANSQFSAVRAAGQLLLLTDPQRVEMVVKGMSTVRSKHWEGRLGFVAGTMNYAIGATKQLEALLRERKMLDGER